MAVTKTNGSGFALYGGAMMPNIESVWDQETYPYALITKIDEEIRELFGGIEFVVNFTNYPAEYDGECCEIASKYPWKWDVRGLVDGQWTAFVDVSENDGSTFASLDAPKTPTIWASYDVLNADGTVYLAATDPIPLDGMTVITWDGDTTGLEVAPGGGVRIADYESASSAFVCISAEGMTFMIDGFRRQEPTFPGWAVALEGSAVVLAYETDIVSSTLPTIRSGIWSTGAEPGARFYLAYVPEGAGGGEEDAFDLTAFLTGLALGLASHGCGYTHTGTDPEGRGFEAGQALRQLRGT